MEEDEEHDSTLATARSHFNKRMCEHEESVIPNACDIAVSFARIREDGRIDTVRSILLALAAPVGTDNTIIPS